MEPSRKRTRKRKAGDDSGDEAFVEPRRKQTRKRKAADDSGDKSFIEPPKKQTRKRKVADNSADAPKKPRKPRAKKSDKASKVQEVVEPVDQVDEPDLDESTTSTSAQLRKDPRQDLRRKLEEVQVAITTRGPIEKMKRAATYRVPPSLIKETSPTLYELIMKNAAETENDGSKIALLDLDSDAFGTFCSWMYNSRIDFAPGTQMLDDGSDLDPSDILASLVDCYVLGKSEKIKCNKFCNAVLSKGCSISKQVGLIFRNDKIAELYRQTRPDSLARKWIVDEWVFQYDSSSDLGSEDMSWANNKELCAEFLWDVMREQACRIGSKAKKQQRPSDNMKKYHERT